MAALAIQEASLAGLNPAFVAASAGGDTFANDGKTYLHVKNAGAAAVTATVNSIKPCDQGSDHDAVVSVPAGGERLIGPFPPGRFNDPNGAAAVTYSDVTSVTVAAVRA